jgi:hypothetical protein
LWPGDFAGGLRVAFVDELDKHFGKLRISAILRTFLYFGLVRQACIFFHALPDLRDWWPRHQTP